MIDNLLVYIIISIIIFILIKFLPTKNQSSKDVVIITIIIVTLFYYINSSQVCLNIEGFTSKLVSAPEEKKNIYNIEELQPTPNKQINNQPTPNSNQVNNNQVVNNYQYETPKIIHKTINNQQGQQEKRNNNVLYMINEQNNQDDIFYKFNYMMDNHDSTISALSEIDNNKGDKQQEIKQKEQCLKGYDWQPSSKLTKQQQEFFNEKLYFSSDDIINVMQVVRESKYNNEALKNLQARIKTNKKLEKLIRLIELDENLVKNNYCNNPEVISFLIKVMMNEDLQNVNIDNDMDYSQYSTNQLQKLGEYDESFSNHWKNDYILLNTDKWKPREYQTNYKCKAEKECPVCPSLTSGYPVNVRDFSEARKILPPDNINIKFIREKLNGGLS